MITYERYTELLSKKIHQSISPEDLHEVGSYEIAQPPVCPKCHIQVRSQFLPSQIVHDVEKCQVKLVDVAVPANR